MVRRRKSHKPAAEGIKSALAPIALVVVFTASIVTAAESFLEFTTLIGNYLYLLASLCWVAVILVALRLDMPLPRAIRTHERSLRRVLVVIATCIFVVTVGWRYYEYNWRRTGPARPPRLEISSAFDALFPRAWAVDTETRPLPLKIESFYLNDELCSFTEMDSRLFGEGPVTRTFAFDNAVSGAFGRGSCVGPRGEAPIRDVLPVLRRRLEKLMKPELLPFVASEADLAHVIAKRGDVFDKLMFSSGELEAMKSSAPPDFATVREWLLSCVGIYQPVLTMVVRNSGDGPLTLTEAVYDVLEIGNVKGGQTGPLYPEVTYNHTLRHKVGKQPQLLKPPLRIAPGDSASFNLRLFSEEAGDGLAWLMKIEIRDSEGNEVATDPFQLIMNKRASP